MSVYKNGNTIVEIKEDGTKIRYVPDNQIAQPEFPESIDLKITNRCAIGCPMCHEQSCPDGKHADLSHPLLDSLHPYTELAIGGGDPMAHPNLEEFLELMKSKKVLSNITVHWSSFMKNYSRLKYYTDRKLIYGLGISVNEKVPTEVIDTVSEFRNAVVHTIIGVADEAVYNQLVGNDLNILLLGYKNFGRGATYRTNKSYEIGTNSVFVVNNLNRFPNMFRAVSFDNLAIEQTNLRRRMKPEAFRQIYMGNDGTFTMYVDLVENKYAVSSTSKRYDIDENNIDLLFAKVREQA